MWAIERRGNIDSTAGVASFLCVNIRTTRTDATPMQSLKAYIVEDSPVIRDSLIATLEELVSVKVVGTAEDEASAVQWMLQLQQPVDLMIIDIFLKSGSDRKSVV